MPITAAARFLPSWFRPWMAWAALVAALCVALGVQTLRLAGERADHSATKSDHAEAMRGIAEATTASIAAALETERQLRGDIETIQARAAKEKADAKAREDALVESVRAGHRRLSVAAVCPGGTGAGASSAGSSGPGAPRAELDPAAAARILAIGRDGDEAIRERNACVAAYEAVRHRLNGVE